MAIKSRDELEVIIMECVMNSFREFMLDLERRIAVVLRHKFPQEVVINIAETVGKDVGEYLLDEVVKSGQLQETVRKML